MALSPDAVADVLAAEYGLPDPDLADQVHEVTAGRADLVRLVASALAAGGALLPEPDSPLWSFIRDELLGGGLPESQRRFISQFADVVPIKAALIETLGHPAQDLTDLTRLGLIAGDRVVPVIAHVARPTTPDQRTAMLTALWYDQHGPPVAAVLAYDRAGHPDQSRRVLDAHGDAILAAGHAAAIIDVLERTPAPRAEPDSGLAALARAVGSDAGAEQVLLVKRTRRQQLLLGDALRTSGQVLAAAQAYAVVAEAEPAWDAGLAWRMGLVHYLRGDSHAALKAFARGEQQAGESADLALLQSWRACAHLQLGETLTAKELAEQGCRTATACGDDTVLATAYVSLALCQTMAGETTDSDELNEQALALAERGGNVVLQARILTSRTYQLLCAAKYADALEAARRTGQCATVAGHTNLRSIALCNQGDALLMLGRYPEAIRQYERAQALCRRMGSRRSAAAHLGLGEVYRRRGWLEQARGAYETAIALAEESGLLQARVSALAGLARTLSTVDSIAAAAAAEQAAQLATGRETVTALLAQGWVNWRCATAPDSAGIAPASPRQIGQRGPDRTGIGQRGPDSAGVGQRGPDSAGVGQRGPEGALGVGGHLGETAGGMAARAAGVAREMRDPAGLAEALELRAATETDARRGRAALREAEAIWAGAGAVVEAARISYRLGHLPGADTDDRLAALQAAETLVSAGIEVMSEPGEARVVVRAFGRFEVCLDGQVVPAAQWQSRKARDLLRILVARRGRPIPRSELCEMLWPDDDPAKTGHRLSVLLSIVKGVLDPERGLAPDHYLVADQACLGLEVTRLRVDVEEFLAEVGHGRRLRERGANEAAYRLLSLAVQAYRADVFEDEPYSEWSSALREEARAAYVSALKALAQLGRGLGEISAAIGYLLRLLSIDNYDEAAHRALIETFAVGGQHGEARRAHARYREAMLAIGVKPAYQYQEPMHVP